jgi:oxygen-independent coproporphyrinogen-3 oxidase
MADLQHLMRPGTLQLPALPPLALYVHLPWCLRKCPYCDFNSHEVKNGELAANTAEAYLAALRADLEAALPLIWGRPIVSVFIGGGTPSLFNPAQIAQLISDLRARLPLEPGCEITLEANPGTFERERFAGFRQAGVTRLSVGVQSFDDAQLKTLGRVHSATQAREGLAEAAGAFETWNLDLMYALPGQTLDDLARELETALSFRPPHLSIYHLTIEPNTVFATRTPEHLPDPDLASDMLDLITAKTGAQGLSRYEVSAYARDGHRCAHNLNYWQFGDYLGIGAGAHSKLSFPHRVLRQVRWREPAAFMAQDNKVSNEHEVARKDLPFEFMLNALRLKAGVTVTQFLERTGLPPSSIAQALETARGRGLLAADPALIQPTERGFDFLSDLQQLFL